MNILSFKRDIVAAASACGIMNKASITHYDVCMALKTGMKKVDIADKFCIDVETVKQIERNKCKDCQSCKEV